jgi:hypothetical protein
MTMTFPFPNVFSVEEQALHVAAAWFEYWAHHRDLDPLLDSPLSAACGGAWVRHLLTLAAGMSVHDRLLVVAYARQGDRDAKAVVSRYILEMHSAGERLPVEFAAYAMDDAAGLLRSQRPPGPRKSARMTRDWLIALCVALLADHFKDLKPTRNRAPSRKGAMPSTRPSFCAIVAHAYGTSEKNVERIWDKLKGGMPTVAGWSGGMIDASGHLRLSGGELIGRNGDLLERLDP